MTTRVGLIVEQALGPVPGGTGRWAREFAAGLARTAPGGALVSGWTAAHRDTTAARVPGVAGPFRLPLDRRALTLAWERGMGPAPWAVDVVHAATPLFPPRRRRPLVVTVHDVVPWTHPETLTPRGAAWHRRVITRARHEADLVVVPTAAVAAALAGRVPGPVPVRVLGAGVSRLPAVTPAARARADALLPDGPVVLSVATLEPRKGLDVAIAAWARLGAAAPVLALVGQPGWGGLDPLAAAGAAGVPAGRVRVLGRVSDDDLAALLDRADLLVAPSRAEGFGLPVAEAMAAGLPAVVSDDPALVEVGGDAVAVVPREDAEALAAAVAGLLADPAARAGMTARGLARAPGFDWDVVARRAWELYREL